MHAPLTSKAPSSAHRGVALHVGEEEADVVGGGVVLEHVVEAPLARARRLVLRLGEVLVQDVAHRRVVHHPRPAVLAEVRPGDLEGVRSRMTSKIYFPSQSRDPAYVLEMNATCLLWRHR